jgi:Mrp family chromosome partitioning ATPase
MSLSKILGIKAPKPPPPPPTIDEAARTIQQTDRLRRRRGVMANVYAANSAPPATGKTTLGG